MAVYRRSLRNISSDGKCMKSYGEKLIADFLFEHDIPYKYEKNHWLGGINYRHFTISLDAKSGLFIEYFGLIDDPDYDAQSEEKRNYWQGKPFWKLLEVTPNQVSAGRDKFFTFFKNLLEENGVKCVPLMEDEIWCRRRRDRKLREPENRKLRLEAEQREKEEEVKRRKQEKLREIENEKLRLEAKRREKKEEVKRKKQEELLKEQRARQARVWKERERQEQEQALAEVKECFEVDFLRTDNFYEERYSDIIARKEYESEKTHFVKSWVRKNTHSKLDDEQSLAIATHGTNIQVIARAGSGKTTTLVNRAIFLQKHCRIPPNRIMLLAFNKRAEKEIETRLKKCLGDSIPHVMTFHALAYAIVHPEESPLHDDPARNTQEKSRVIQSVIDDCIRNPKFKNKIRVLMLEHFRADWERIIKGWHDQGKSEFITYRRSLQNVGLDGKYIKSYGEKLIADFLFEHDIPYKYEKNHEWDGINYRPDFTIFPDAKSGFIIEYFGLIGDPDYDAQSEEKRNYWQGKPFWKLLEVTPNQVSAGRDKFFTFFKNLLEENGVKCVPLMEDEIWRRIKGRAIDKFTLATKHFIERCRQLSLSPEQLGNLIHSKNDFSSVEGRFLEIAQYLYGAYLNSLNDTGEEDFDGLMQKAAKNIREGQTVFKRKPGEGDLGDIRYMFIDEYQDFSDLFLRLVDAIRVQNERIEFFCVGDDWQSINGFAGSDLQFYKNFKQYFSPSCELYISTNYRSSKSIVALGNALMEGLGKPARAFKSKSGTILLGDLEKFEPSDRENERHAGDKVTPAVLRLVSGLVTTDKNVIILSRTNVLPYDYVNYDAIKPHQKKGLDLFCDLIHSYFPEELRDRISTSTVHKYKGLENDAVIVLDAVLQRYPHIHPNWIFTRVLGDNIEKLISEERRLFYVALTRAVNTLIILTKEQLSSPFLEDITPMQALDPVNWDSFSPVREDSRLTVRVKNLNGRNTTFAIREQLKASGYWWKSKNRVWQRSFLEEDFSIECLKNSTWSPVANEIRVEIVNEHKSLVHEYVIHSGRWSSIYRAK